MKYALGKMLECRTSKLLTNLEKLVWMLRVIPTWTNVATLVNLRKKPCSDLAFGFSKLF